MVPDCDESYKDLVLYCRYLSCKAQLYLKIKYNLNSAV